MATRKKQKNPNNNDVGKLTLLGIGGVLLYQLLNSPVVQQVGQVVQSCCGR